MKHQNFKTPIEEIFFRSSKNGLLAGGLIRHGLTEKQREEMEILELQKITPEGLTERQREEMEALELQKITPEGISEKQQIDLDVWASIVNEGGVLPEAKLKKMEEYKLRLITPKKLTPSQEEKLIKYKAQLTTPKPLTEAQEGKLQDLKERNAKPPELSQGAKTYVKEVWLQNEKGFREDVTDKKLRKGLQAEEDAINLISFVDGVMYVKNEKRISKNNMTGEADVVTIFRDMETENGDTIDAVVIDDTKCSWNPRTFMNAELTTGYEWQGRNYLHLYEGDIFRLRHCLVNCPPEVLIDEYKKYCFTHGIIDDTVKDYEPLIQQFIRNYIYDLEALNFDSSQYPETIVKLATKMEFNYTLEERVKTFSIVRDYELEGYLLKAVELAVEYYQTITLNMIDS